MTAHGPLPGRGMAPQTVTGSGADEVAALRDLDDRLRGVPRPDGGRLMGLTADELERVPLRRAPGDRGP